MMFLNLTMEFWTQVKVFYGDREKMKAEIGQHLCKPRDATGHQLPTGIISLRSLRGKQPGSST